MCVNVYIITEIQSEQHVMGESKHIDDVVMCIDIIYSIYV